MMVHMAVGDLGWITPVAEPLHSAGTLVKDYLARQQLAILTAAVRCAATAEVVVGGASRRLRAEASTWLVLCDLLCMRVARLEWLATAEDAETERLWAQAERRRETSRWNEGRALSYRDDRRADRGESRAREVWAAAAASQEIETALNCDLRDMAWPLRGSSTAADAPAAEPTTVANSRFNIRDRRYGMIALKVHFPLHCAHRPGSPAQVRGKCRPERLRGFLSGS